MTQAQIRKKYNIGAGTLGNKIKREGWRLSHEQTSAVKEFKDASVKISESFHNANEIQKKELVDRVITVMEDNELISNNRKILKGFQNLIAQGVKNKTTYKTAGDIRAGVGSIKDIETIANPKSDNNLIVNNQNSNTQQNNEVKIEWE